MSCLAGGLAGEFQHVDLRGIGPASQASFWWLVGPGAIVAYTAYGYAVRTLPTHVVATYAYVNPVVAVALGAIVLREPLTPSVLTGGVVIVLAVFAILQSGERNKSTPNLAAEGQVAPLAES